MSRKIKITEVKPPSIYKPKNPLNTLYIFLAGSIEMNKAEMWQDNFISKFKEFDINNRKIEEVVFYNPRRDHWDSSWKQSLEDKNFTEQVEWELENIGRSDIIAFYFQPGTNSPISLMELGIVSNDSFNCSKNVIVLCPDGYHRKGNVDIASLWFDMNRASSMDDLIGKTKQKVEEHTFD